MRSFPRFLAALLLLIPPNPDLDIESTSPALTLGAGSNVPMN
jgi:hypothetical protein